MLCISLYTFSRCKINVTLSVNDLILLWSNKCASIIYSLLLLFSNILLLHLLLLAWPHDSIKISCTFVKKKTWIRAREFLKYRLLSYILHGCSPSKLIGRIIGILFRSRIFPVLRGKTIEETVRFRDYSQWTPVPPLSSVFCIIHN